VAAEFLWDTTKSLYGAGFERKGAPPFLKKYGVSLDSILYREGLFEIIPKTGVKMRKNRRKNNKI